MPVYSRCLLPIATLLLLCNNFITFCGKCVQPTFFPIVIVTCTVYKIHTCTALWGVGGWAKLGDLPKSWCTQAAVHVCIPLGCALWNTLSAPVLRCGYTLWGLCDCAPWWWRLWTPTHHGTCICTCTCSSHSPLPPPSPSPLPPPPTLPLPPAIRSAEEQDWEEIGHSWAHQDKLAWQWQFFREWIKNTGAVLCVLWSIASSLHLPLPSPLLYM